MIIQYFDSCANVFLKKILAKVWTKLKLVNMQTDSLLSNFIHEHNVIVTEKRTTEEFIELIYEQYAPTSAFYIVNLGEVISLYNTWNEIFPFITPYYAIKANSNKLICKLLALLGSSFDVASVNEINIVKDLVNGDMSRIIYANPTKETTSISYARSVDVDLLVVDCVNEIYKIKLYHPEAKLLLRVKVDDSGSLCKFSTKFGANEEEIVDIIKLSSYLGLALIGVSFHVGSQCNDPEQFYKAIKVAHTAFEIASKNGLSFEVIDIGGGFVKNKDLLLKTRENIDKALEEFFGDYCLEQNPNQSPNQNHADDSKPQKPLRIIAEPGRLFVSSTHTLVLNVIGKKSKKINNEQCFCYTLNDGIYNSFNCITYDHQKPVIIPYNNKETQKYKSTLVGCTCDSIDTISIDSMLPMLELGDSVYVESFGAYTESSSSRGFNGFAEIRKFYVLSK